MNFIVLTFSFLTTVIIILGSLINAFENRLPAFFVKTFKYGKFAYKGEVSETASKFIIEVPKSWFKHFYQTAILIYAYVFYTISCSYIFKCEVPGWFINFMNLICGENRNVSSSATKTYIAVVLMTLQVFRRFYDIHFVSLFGKNSRMNLSQYLSGLYHYPGCALAILCEAPKFGTKPVSTISTTFDITSITYVDIVAILLFIWAWWHQHITTKILADLRKNKKGVAVSDEHKLPHGDWFNYLSSPHQTAEILMYIALTILLWPNITWLFVFAWVFSNQVETILLSHWWYKETFNKFPKNRKALIPFVY